jgi:hypothetical protein
MLLSNKTIKPQTQNGPTSFSLLSLECALKVNEKMTQVTWLVVSTYPKRISQLGLSIPGEDGKMARFKTTNHSS